MEPSLTIVVVGTDGSSFSLNASMNPFLCSAELDARQLAHSRVPSAGTGFAAATPCAQQSCGLISTAAWLEAVERNVRLFTVPRRIRRRFRSPC